MDVFRDPEWAFGIAVFATIFSFFGSLTICWRVWYSRNSSGVAFWPIASTTICLLAWLIYGCTTWNYTIMNVAVPSLFLMAINTTVHRWFSHDRGPGLAVVAAIWLMCFASAFLPVAGMGPIARGSAVACSLVPIDGIILMMPLSQIAMWTFASSVLWIQYAKHVGDVTLAMSSVIGSVVAVAELVVSARLLFMRGACSSEQRM
ncbi:hypothetical protein HPB50_012372 [Hyalomma asiaticum]|uniref:Uncharacterized protein n=1 Tax=Hyalomma asiaticum TaxID=266040 RepID=A0ACB7TJ43_HYAAI|nr:hypothetical protein HPB50_012372 [Hyalomma asiaticum]